MLLLLCDVMLFLHDVPLFNAWETLFLRQETLPACLCGGRPNVLKLSTFLLESGKIRLLLQINVFKKNKRALILITLKI